MSGPKCLVARYWGNGRRAWRCNLPSKHEGKHYDNVRQMYWGDAWRPFGKPEPAEQEGGGTGV